MAVRDKRVSFKMEEEKKEKLEEYANNYGVSISALCTMIVGQWLHQQESLNKPMVELVQKHALVKVDEFMNEFQEFMQEFTGDMVKEQIGLKGKDNDE